MLILPFHSPILMESLSITSFVSYVFWWIQIWYRKLTTIICSKNLNFATVLYYYHEYKFFNKISVFKFGFAQNNQSESIIIIKFSDKIFMTINGLNGQWTSNVKMKEFILLSTFITIELKWNFSMFGIVTYDINNIFIYIYKGKLFV